MNKNRCRNVIFSVFCFLFTAASAPTITILYNVSDVLMQVVQEYERAVIFRLGRLLVGGAKGPGMLVDCVLLFYSAEWFTLPS